MRDGLLSDVVLSLAAAPNGDLWVGTPDGLNRIHRGAGKFVHLGRWIARRFYPLAAGGCGWLALDRHAARADALDECTQANRGRWRPIRRRTGWAAIWWARWRATRDGNLWVATLAGLSRLEGGKITNYTTANGLSSNVVTALLPRSDGTLLIGTQDHGWNLWDGATVLRR